MEAATRKAQTEMQTEQQEQEFDLADLSREYGEGKP